MIDNIFPKGRVFALSDIHGCYKIYEQIKTFLEPNDIVFFIGDAGDRGPRGWECIKAIYADPQFIYLKGNHEDMLFEAMLHYPWDYGALAWNGGIPTVEAWAHEDNADLSWIDKMKNLPLVGWYINKGGDFIIMSHSGYLHPDFEPTSECGVAYNPPGQEEDYLWDREVLTKTDWDREENTFIVHGHSPIPICFFGLNKQQELDNWEPNTYWHCAAHMIDIDMGTHYTGWACLIDLDTGDEHYFETNERAQ